MGNDKLNKSFIEEVLAILDDIDMSEEVLELAKRTTKGSRYLTEEEVAELARGSDFTTK